MAKLKTTVLRDEKRRSLVSRLLVPPMIPLLLLLLVAPFALRYVYVTYLSPSVRSAKRHLAEADKRSEAAIDARLKSLSEVFAGGRQGSRAFADEALSLRGKWQFVRGMVVGGAHQQFLAESFGRHAFTPEDLDRAMKAAVRGYLDDVEGIEAEMLVRLRADLADPQRPSDQLPTHLRDDAAFRTEFERLVTRVATQVGSDAAMSVSREAGMFVASDIAAVAALQAAQAAAAQLGVNAGILATGAGSVVATVGVGIVVAIILDYVLDELFRMAGYDPATKLAGLVSQSINRMEAALVRQPAPKSKEAKGALRQRLEELHQARSKLRREAVLQLMKGRGK